MASDARYARNVALFGTRGQELISSSHVAIIGLGGVGAHLAQQLAYLGVTTFTFVDHDLVTESNLNRLIGALVQDIGAPKVEIARRTVEAIQPEVNVSLHKTSVGALLSRGEFEPSMADILIGAVDADPVRLELLSATADSATPYLDCASDVLVEDDALHEYGGRVAFSFVEGGCLSCLDLLNQRELRRTWMTEEELATDNAIYGVPRSVLNARGPSVVSLNGVVASLAVTELMVWRVGLRAPQRILTYGAHHGGVRPSRDQPRAGCHYCTTYRTGATS
jgi:molybdopterin/thiamine biosynthesis adenylyltransferase